MINGCNLAEDKRENEAALKLSTRGGDCWVQLLKKVTACPCADFGNVWQDLNQFFFCHYG